jgi:hypothetical protein
MADTPTSRTLRWLRKEGWTAGVVEKWVPQTKRRVDFLGCIDIIAVSDLGTIGVQATSTGNMASRVKKICSEPNMRRWIKAGNGLWVVGWAMRGKPGKRKLWTQRVQTIGIDDVTLDD